MKKIVFILSMVLIATTCASPCMAKQKTVTYKYKASNKSLTISGKYLKGKLLPDFSEKEGYNEATKYDYKWSPLRMKVKKIILKDGIKKIGHNAFGDFGKLESVKFPKGLKSIGAYAFCDTRIKKLDLPDEIEEIKSSAFKSTMVSGKIKKLKLPAKLRKIGKAAFEEQKMSEVTIPSKVEKIETRAFCGCEYLKKIVIKSKKLKKVGSRAFADMGKDAVIYIPKERETEYRKMIEDSTAHAQIMAQ